MAGTSEALSQLLDRARSRRIFQLILDQSGIALGAAFAGLIILMIAGTQVLDWYWLAIVFAATLGYGVWRMWRQVPSRYQLAQQIDQQLGLYDTLSTAINFEDPSRRADPNLREAQRAVAERTATTVPVETAVPVRVPRTLYVTAAIACVAGGMFALRYGVTRSLDLKPSLVKIAFDHFFQPDLRAANDKRSPWRQKLDEELQKLGINVNTNDAQQDKIEPSPDSALTAKDTPETSGQSDPDSAKSKVANVPNEQESGEAGGDEKSERASSSAEKGGNEQSPEGNDGTPQEGKESAQKSGKESQGQNASMLDKMRDAMSNLMNKLKMNSKPGGDSKNAQDAKNGQSQQQQGKGEKSQSAGKQQSNGGEQQDQQGQQQAQGDQSQAAKGKSGDKSANPEAAQDAKSGIGKQDGDKSAREAEQLAAMGKISEILGKRAKDVTGEIMVEVSSGKQQLKTQYSSNKSAHAEAGGEISRDEVPIEYQDYVQHYFEQVRKQPAAAAKKPAAAPPAR